jgi:ABC-type transport system involved in multi-copper enzyme maturation permease subunit
MRLSKAWIVASKDFKIFFKKKSILYSIFGFEVFIAIGLPIIVRFIARKATGSDISQILPAIIDSFSFWFVIWVSILPVGIASYSLVGEKVQKSLEPLLATPTTDEEILVGKVIAAFIPAIVSNFIGAGIFMLLVNYFTFGTLSYLYFPNWTIAVELLLLAPLVCLLSIGYNVLISSRVNDIRAAQQTGSLIILPLGAVYVLSEIGVLSLATANLLIMSGVIVVLDVIVFYLVSAAFRREEILTQWK